MKANIEMNLGKATRRRGVRALVVAAGTILPMLAAVGAVPLAHVSQAAAIGASVAATAGCGQASFAPASSIPVANQAATF